MEETLANPQKFSYHSWGAKRIEADQWISKMTPCCALPEKRDREESKNTRKKLQVENKILRSVV